MLGNNTDYIPISYRYIDNFTNNKIVINLQ